MPICIRYAHEFIHFFSIILWDQIQLILFLLNFQDNKATWMDVNGCAADKGGCNYLQFTSKLRYCPFLWFDSLNGRAEPHSPCYTNASHPPCCFPLHGLWIWKWNSIKYANWIRYYPKSMSTNNKKIVLFVWSFFWSHLYAKMIIWQYSLNLIERLRHTNCCFSTNWRNNK